MKALLEKHKENGDIKFALIYFNFTAKTVINSEYLDKSFREILYRNNNWVNKGSGWMIESIDAEYVNISIYTSLSGSTYIKLLVKLRNSMKGLINIKNNDNKCFPWCHVRHLNSLKIHAEKIIRTWLLILIMKVLNF